MKKFSFLLPYSFMIDEGVCLTRDATFLFTIKVTAHDFTFSNDSKVLTVLQTIKNALRYFDTNYWNFYIDSFRYQKEQFPVSVHNAMPGMARVFELCRQSIGERFYATDSYITFCYEVPPLGMIDKFMFKTYEKKDKQNIEIHLIEFKKTCFAVINLLRNAFSNVEVLNSKQQLAYFYRTITTIEVPTLKVPSNGCFINEMLADGIFYPDTVTKLNDKYVLCLTVYDFPTHTHYDDFSAMLKLPAEFRLTTRYRYLTKNAAKKLIEDIRQTHSQKTKGGRAMVAEAISKQESSLIDEEAQAYTEQASQAMGDLASGDMTFGYLNTVITVMDKSYDNALKRVEYLKKQLGELEYVAKIELLNSPLAYLGSLPGNIFYNKRQYPLSTYNLAHCFPINGKYIGDFTNEHLKKYYETYDRDNMAYGQHPHMVVKAGNSIFYVNLADGDVGHTLIAGITGSGKSILLNTLAIEFLRYPNASVFFFDKDKSSQFACKNCDGDFFELGGEADTMRFNIFDGIENKDYRDWLTEFLCNYLNQKKISVSPKQQSEISQSLESLATIEKKHIGFETFVKFLQVTEFREAFKPFYGKGEYSYLFKNGTCCFKESKWTTFEMNQLMEKSKEIIQFIIGYIFHKLEQEINKNVHPRLLCLDEAWLFLDNEYFAQKVRNYLKTFRKKFCYVVLATQEIADLVNSAQLFSTILSSCTTKIFLSNKTAHVKEMADLYKSMGLTDKDIVILSSVARAKQDYYFTNSKGKQLFSMELTETNLRILTTFLSEEEKSALLKAYKAA